MKSRDLFALGADPSQYIIYPGGNAYYIDEALIDALTDKGIDFDYDELEHLFWDFLDPAIQRVVDGFQKNTSKKTSVSSGTVSENPFDPHIFDKRRIHFLRFGQIDQGYIGRAPKKLFKRLEGKSRDEIEQYFLREERVLKESERNLYIFVIFDLQRYFNEPWAKKLPSALSQQKLDHFFIRSICDFNTDSTFWSGYDRNKKLNEYLIRYVIMYFDNAIPQFDPLKAYVNEFINQRRTYRPPPSVQIKVEKMCQLFEMDKKTLFNMTRKEIIRKYRKLAQKHHPDKGGEHETFIELTHAFKQLLRQNKRKGANRR